MFPYHPCMMLVFFVGLGMGSGQVSGPQSRDMFVMFHHQRTKTGFDHQMIHRDNSANFNSSTWLCMGIECQPNPVVKNSCGHGLGYTHL